MDSLNENFRGFDTNTMTTWPAHVTDNTTHDYDGNNVIDGELSR